LIDLGDLFNQQARFDEALPILQKAVAIAPRNIRAHETLAKTFLNLNRLPESATRIGGSHLHGSQSAALHYLLARFTESKANLEKAKLEMDRFQTLKAKEPPPNRECNEANLEKVDSLVV